MGRHRLLRGWWIAKHLFALVIFSMLVTLAWWQFARLAERRAANAAQLAGLAQELTAYPLDGDVLGLIGRRVTVSGTFLNEQSVVLRARESASGVTGVELITPLLLDNGRAVLVNRGWLPAAAADTAARAAYAAVGRQTLEALVTADQPRPDSALAGRDLPLPGEARIEAWLRLDIAGIGRQVDVPLEPVSLQQLPVAGSNGALPRPRDLTLVDEGPHLSYALQWLAFAGMMLIVYSALIATELRRDPTQR